MTPIFNNKVKAIRLIYYFVLPNQVMTVNCLKAKVTLLNKRWRHKNIAGIEHLFRSCRPEYHRGFTLFSIRAILCQNLSFRNS